MTEAELKKDLESFLKKIGAFIICLTLALASIIGAVVLYPHTPLTASTTETRYFTAGYGLSTVQSSSPMDDADSGGHSGGGYLGLLVYVGSNSTAIGGSNCVAVSSPRATGTTSYKSGTWNCPAQNVFGNIKVSVYSCTSTGVPYELIAAFVTAETNIFLNASTWTVQYGIKWTSGSQTTDFYFGSSSNFYNSYISNFTWTALAPGSNPPSIQDFWISSCTSSSSSTLSFNVSDPLDLYNATLQTNETGTPNNQTIQVEGTLALANFTITLPSAASTVALQLWLCNINSSIYATTGLRTMLCYPTNANYTTFLNLGAAITTVENSNNWGTTDPYLSVVLDQNNTSILNTMIDNYATSHDWYHVLEWSAICYKLGILQANDIKYALGNITMCYSSTYTGYLPEDSNTNSFSAQYGKALLYGFFFNAIYHVNDTRWNIANAYHWFNTTEYSLFPSNQVVEDFTPAGGYTTYPGPRYYDEFGDTIEDYIIFAELLNVSGALNDALVVWNLTNTVLWSGSFFEYQASQPAYECESAFFLKIISELKYYVSNLNNWTNVLADTGNRFLNDEWRSAQWEAEDAYGQYPSTYAVVHAFSNITGSNTQTRLQNTLGAWQAMEGVYTRLNSTYQSKIQDMLLGNNNTRPAWQLLLSNYTFDNAQSAANSLYNMTSKQFRVHSVNNTGNGFIATDSNATALGEITMFMMGIIPNTTTVAFPLEELSYEYYYDIDPVINQFNLNSTTRQVNVSVTGPGYMTFQYGNTPISVYFSRSGVWRVLFTASWNNLLSLTFLTALPTNVIYFGQAQLTVGWNNVGVSEVDVGHTLGDVNASLNRDGLNWTYIVYANSSTSAQAEFYNGFSYDAAVTVYQSTGTLEIWCNVAGTWNHVYS